jgi:hypothetical protein
MDLRETEYGSVEWIHSAADGNQRQAVVRGTSVLIKRDFLIRRMTVTFSEGLCSEKSLTLFL